MNIFNKNLFLFFLWFQTTTYAQENIPIGTWRSHTSYANAINLTFGENKVFCQTEFGLFFLDLEDQSLNTITINDDISSVNFAEIQFLSSSNMLLITYEDGDLDFWREDELINFNVITNSNIIGRRRINNIKENEGLTYLSTEFGVVVINPVEIEVDEAYVGLGPAGEQIAINSSAFFQDTIFLATNTGVISASLSNSVNRLDFNVWDRTQVEGDSPVSSIELFNNTLYAAIDNRFLFQYENGSWIQTSVPVNGESFELKSRNGNLFLVTEEEVLIIESSGSFSSLTANEIASPQSIEILENGQLYVADFENGLLEIQESEISSIIPAGPISNQITDLLSFNGTTLAVHENSNSVDLSEGFSQFELGGWNQFTSDVIPNVENLVSMNLNGFTNQVQFASFGSGVLDWDLAEEFIVLNDMTPGSTLDSDGTSILISDVKSDFEGNLWIANFDSDLPLHKLNVGGEWESFSFNIPASRFPEQLLIASTGDVWIILRDAGILVFNEESGSFRQLSSSESNGSLPSSTINSIIEDLDGQIWAATSSGIAAFTFPFDIINNDQIEAFVPIIDGRLLFDEENVVEIAIDGGNRKWISTADGAFLFNESVSELETTLNTENSLLVSNNISAISIDNTKGEIFFATDRGLVSFRGTATLGNEFHSDVKVFPNPVPSNFEGLVGISGLANDVNLKITDVSGKLVREVLSNGGTAVWDARDLNGRKVQTGIYLILSSTADGEENFAGKFAVVE
ncbi:MAG: hypothetical protein AAF363_03980 [Bacteroidota bacterium]